MESDLRSIVLGLAVVALIFVGLYLIDPTLFGLLKASEGFQTMGADANFEQPAGLNELAGMIQKRNTQTNPNSAGGDMDASGNEGFEDASGNEGFTDEEEQEEQVESFANIGEDAGPAAFGSAQGPAGCYPRDQLTPGELLPKDGNSVWAQQNPMGTGSLKSKNFLSAGALIGVNTVGQSLRNANYQLRSEPPNPQVPVSVFNNSTIEPDINRRDLEIN
jgi:hypothetical protein